MEDQEVGDFELFKRFPDANYDDISLVMELTQSKNTKYRQKYSLNIFVKFLKPKKRVGLTALKQYGPDVRQL